MTRLILVGRVSGGFGVRGDVRIGTYTEDPMALARYKRLLREDGSPALTIASARPAKGGIVARCPEVTVKEAADALRGLRLYVPRDALPPTEDEDEFYLTDLIGLAAETEDGQSLGKVKAVQNFGAGDILEIDPGNGRPTVFLPFTRVTVPQVRIDEGRLIVVPPLLDDSRDDEETPE